MHNKLSRAAFLSSGSALGMLLTTIIAAPAAAQSTPSPADASDPSEIVVTASRRDTTALKTPINISAISGADLEKSGTSDFSALARSVPGMVYTGTSIRNGGANNSFIIHGLNLDDGTATGDSPLPTLPPVSTYVNETPTFVNLRLMDVKRIEVLRGPQASLYGLSSIGGTVRILLNEPDLKRAAFKLTTQLSQTKHAGSPNFSADAVANLPLSDRFAARVSAGYSRQAGFIDAKHLFQLDANGIPVLETPGDLIHSLPVSRSERDINKAEMYYVRPSLLYENEGLKLLLTYQHQHETANANNYDEYPGTTGPTSYSSVNSPGFLNDRFDAAFPAVFDQYETGAFLPQPYERNVDLASLEASYDFGFATLTSTTSWYRNDVDSITDASAPYQKSLAFLYSGYPRLSTGSRRMSKDKGEIQELRLVSNGDTKFSYSIGAFYMRQKNRFLQEDSIAGFTQFSEALGIPTGTDLAFLNGRSIRFKDAALYGEMTYHITPKWQITGGARLYNQKLDITTINQQPICGVFCSQFGDDPLGTSTGAAKTSKTSKLFKLNTSYEVNPGLLIFGTFSQGQRRGGANGVPLTGPFGVPPIFQFFDPDKVNNYEVGFKGRPSSAFDFSASFYWIDWQKPQVNITTPIAFLPAVVNGSKARSRGVDFESRLRLAPGLTVAATYSYNDAELTRDVSVGGAIFGVAGRRLPGTPHHLASFSSTYEQPLAGGYELSLQAGANWRSNTTTELQPASSVTLPSFLMANASIGISKDRWRATIFADNITNTRGVLSSRNLLIFDPRGISNQVQTPATIGIRIGYDY
ncbi:TonB-dependent receptor [Sphingopyxis sp. USTB-05]|uniref:TonB-dependent receptor n=1 Tax=Sphingopyxis sp. USTB-05 TaxID=2830667 RepID=UPI002078FC99|nr:TonB-dependent receptor [Sphingopyxis sp. USTB-05]USI77605.1 TonB-dependent receptor [Sphingopyxis sp. USTB-05]